MPLSNSATPKYYGAFRDAVLSAEIPVCRELSLEMNRIDALIASPNIYYDPEAVESWVRFCESEMTLTDGSDLHLLDSFKLWGEQLYGWYYFTDRSVYVPGKNGSPGHYEKKTIKHRLIKKQYLIVGRGAAKSLYDTCVQAYELVTNPETTFQITVAPTMAQAEEVMGPFRTAIARARGPLFKFLTEGSLQNTTGPIMARKKLYPSKKGIEMNLTNSILQVRVMSIDKLQGLRPKVGTVDEWLSGDTREDVVGSIEQGASKLEDYIILATSSEGTIRNSAGDSIKMELLDILKGEYPAPHVSIFWYKLDDVSEVSNPYYWIKANPNIGKTVSYEAYQLDVERAEKAPSARNDILAKRFGLPMQGYTYFFPYEETLVHPKREYFGMACALGIDASQGDDFCAFTFLFPLPDGSFGIKARSYITERTLLRLPPAMKNKYDEFIIEGSLIIIDGSVLDMDVVYQDLIDHIDRKGYDVRTVGYDRYNIDVILKNWIADNGEYGLEKVIQGAKTETVPLGELKAMSEDRILLFDQEIMSFTMGNAVVMEDTNGNRKLLKKRYDQKIDNVSALMDAYVAYKIHKEYFD